MISCLGAPAKQTDGDIHFSFSAENGAQLGHYVKWHYEECCTEMLFVLTVIAGTFNAIAAIYFQVCVPTGRLRVSVRVHKFKFERVCVCVCVCVAV